MLRQIFFHNAALTSHETAPGTLVFLITSRRVPHGLPESGHLFSRILPGDTSLVEIVLKYRLAERNPVFFAGVKDLLQ